MATAGITAGTARATKVQTETTALMGTIIALVGKIMMAKKRLSINSPRASLIFTLRSLKVTNTLCEDQGQDERLALGKQMTR